MEALQGNNWQPVCGLQDLVADSGICALVNGEQVAIFYLPTQTPPLYAIGNWDPIGQANVLSRGMVADLGGELTVASPLYKQHFSLSSGQCLEDAAVKVPVYDVAFNGDAVMIGE